MSLNGLEAYSSDYLFLTFGPTLFTFEVTTFYQSYILEMSVWEHQPLGRKKLAVKILRFYLKTMQYEMRIQWSFRWGVTSQAEYKNFCLRYSRPFLHAF